MAPEVELGEGVMERGIIFSDLMVRAILDGRKTQTRRLLRAPVVGFKPGPIVRDPKTGVGGLVYELAPGINDTMRAPYIPGDRLWVREAWAELHETDPRTDKPLTGLTMRADGDGLARSIGYRASMQHFEWVDGDGFAEYRKDGKPASHWRSPLFMPRWASRIDLDAIDLKVQRLHDISEEDARAEGVELGGWMMGDPAPGEEYRATFAALWDRINGDRAPWFTNPWVWAITFRRVVAASQEAA